MGAMLDVVCFDLMGTVVYDPYLEALEAGTGMDLAAAHRVKDPDSWPLFELGAIDEAEFVRRFFVDGYDAPFDVEAFHRVRREGYRFLEGMEALLEALAGQVRRYVASNYPVWIEEMRTQFAMDRHFDGVYASCHLGVRKPDPAFFAALLDRIEAAAPRCLFVDDRRVNCDAAAAAGMAVHLFDGAEGLRDRLAAEGLRV
jgi:HAD superfamily hydrolase (TIGR01509 family)